MSKEVNLTSLHIKPSQQLWLAQLLFSCLLIISSLFATFPLLFHSPQWLLIEFAFVCTVFVWIVQCYKSFKQSTFELRVFSGEITIKRIVTDSTGEQSAIPVRINGEILVWPGVMVIHFQSIKDHKNFFRFVVLQDSCTAEDWRQLRVYLLSRG